MKKISVIIPIYNALTEVKNCLNSILKNFDFNIGEIILVNDCSNIQTSDYLNEFTKQNPNFTLVNNENNLGFIKTCNKGINLANGEIVILLNSDTEIPKGFCQKIIECFESDTKIGVASPIASHSWQFNIPLPLGYSIDRVNNLLQKKHKPTYPTIPSAEGFCFCIRNEVIKMQGGLNEEYGKGYHEEVDFSYRAIKNGWKNVLIDNLYVYHRRNASFKGLRKKLIKQNNEIFNNNWNGFREKYEKEIDFVNPIYKIKKEIFPIKSFLFAIEKKQNRKIVRILGIEYNIR